MDDGFQLGLLGGQGVEVGVRLGVGGVDLVQAGLGGLDLADGLLDEVRDLRERGLEGGVTARRAIGYAQALAQLSGEMTASQAIEETQALTRRYARRQVSWFKRYRGVGWVDPGADAAALADSTA